MLSSASSCHWLTPAGVDPHKPLLVYLPGMDGTGALLAKQVPSLKPHFEVRCLALPSDDLSPWPVLARQVRDLIAEVRHGRPLYLCGESFGACLALEILAQQPALADYLILINPASSFHRLSWLHWIGQITPWLMPNLFQTSTLSSLPVLANLHRVELAERQQLLAAVQSVSQATAAWRIKLLAQFRIHRAALAQIQAPTLLIAALADRLLPSLAEAQHLATLLPQPQIYPLPHSGHVSLLEAAVDLSEIFAATGFLPQLSPLLAQPSR